MKKITLFLLAVMAGFIKLDAQVYVSTNVENRNVLIEEFTGRKCINCPPGHIVANAIVADYPGRVIPINLHGGYYSSLDYPNLNTPMCDSIGVAFNPNSFPSALINRVNVTPTSSNMWRTYAETQLQQTAECNLAGRVAINPVSRVATVNVEVYYTSDSPSDVNYLNVVMIQDSIIGSQTGAASNPDQLVGESDYCHMHVMRANVTPIWGEEITTTTAGALVSKTYEYEIPEIIGDPNGAEVVLENVHFVAFVTEKHDGTKTLPILNSNMLHTEIETDESVLPYMTSVYPKYATTCTDDVTLSINVSNEGQDELTSIKFEISVDDAAPIEFVWNGNVLSNQSVTIETDVPMSLGEHDVDVRLVEANGVGFDVLKSTVALREKSLEVMIDGDEEQFEIEIAQDKYGNQITWELKASDHTVLASGGPYKMLASGYGTKVHTEKVVIEAGECVRFVINDQIGNGICCDYGEGYYKIKDSKGNVIIDGNGEFGSQASHVLAVNNLSTTTPKYVSTEVLNKNVIIEEFTGRNCPNCPAGHIISSNIVKNNPDRAWSMAIHSGYFAPTTYPNFNTDASAVLVDPYDDVEGGLSLPTGLVNRTTEATIGRAQWSDAAENVLRTPAECNVAGNVEINPITRVATIEAEVYYTANSAESTNYLTIVMLQDSIVGEQAYAETNPAQHMGGDNYCHMHVLRDIITADWGDEISATTEGSYFRKTYEYLIPDTIGNPNGVAVDLDNISFIAFVTEKYQGVPTRPILNGNKLSLKQTSNEKDSPYISDIVMEDGIFCTNDRTFKTYITNVGTNTLTSVNFEVFIDGKDKTKHFWNGTLNPDESTRFDIDLEIPAGTHEIKFKVYEANGTDLNYVKTMTVVCDEWTKLDLGCFTEYELTIEIMQDKYGNHTTWEFLSSDGTVLASGGPYKYLPDASTKLNTANVTVRDGECYKFAIYDSFGNGICCDDGDGYYRIVDSKNTEFVVVYGDGDFGSGAHDLISVVATGGVNEKSETAYEIFPNPVKDMLTVKGENISQVTIFNSLGQIVRKIECNDNIVNINLDSMQPGIYFVNILDGNGKSATSKVSVMK